MVFPSPFIPFPEGPRILKTHYKPPWASLPFWGMSGERPGVAEKPHHSLGLSFITAMG